MGKMENIEHRTANGQHPVGVDAERVGLAEPGGHRPPLQGTGGGFCNLSYIWVDLAGIKMYHMLHIEE